MNVKFILFCIASLGCLMMMYLWFTMHKAVINSQLNEEQYLYRISSLKSEVDFEKRLIDTLRKDTKNLGQKFLESSILYEKKQKESLNKDKDRIKLEQQTEKLKADLEKISKSNEGIIKDIKSKAESSKSSDTNEMEMLLKDKNKWERELDELLAAQKKPPKKTQAEPEEVNLNKANEMRQGKAPILNKINTKNKEINKSNKKLYPLVPEPNVERTQQSNSENIKEIQDTKSRQNTRLISDKIESNTDLTTKITENVEIKTHQEQQKDIPKKSAIQPKTQTHNIKDDNINNEFISKDEHFLKSPLNPKILPKIAKNQDYYIPKKNVKSDDELIKEEIDQQKSKDNMESIHQLKPPRKEEYPKEKDHNQGYIAKLGVKNDVNSEVEHDI